MLDIDNLTSKYAVVLSQLVWCTEIQGSFPMMDIYWMDHCETFTIVSLAERL